MEFQVIENPYYGDGMEADIQTVNKKRRLSDPKDIKMITKTRNVYYEM